MDRGRGHPTSIARMHRFLATRPQLEHARVPSVAALRLEFVSALKVGNWSRAEACVNEIDHWTLDHASATLQMRIRLLDARGETKNCSVSFGNTRPGISRARDELLRPSSAQSTHVRFNRSNNATGCRPPTICFGERGIRVSST